MRHNELGSNEVTMRSGLCTCGCRGRDSQHAKTLTRVVHNIRYFTTEPQCLTTKDFKTIDAVAIGEIRVPGGRRLVGFEIVMAGDTVYPMGWRALDMAVDD